MCVCLCVCLCSQPYAGGKLLPKETTRAQLCLGEMPGVFLASKSVNLGAVVPARRNFLLTKQSLCMVHIYPGYIDLRQILTNNQANAL